MLPKINDTFETRDLFRLAIYTAAVEHRLPLVESQRFQVLTVHSPLPSLSLPSAQAWNLHIELSPKPGVGWTVTALRGASGSWDDFRDTQQKIKWKMTTENKLNEIRKKLKLGGYDRTPSFERQDGVSAWRRQVGEATALQGLPSQEEMFAQRHYESDSMMHQNWQDPSKKPFNAPPSEPPLLDQHFQPRFEPSAKWISQSSPEDLVEEKPALPSTESNETTPERERSVEEESGGESSKEEEPDDASTGSQTVFRGDQKSYVKGQWDWSVVGGSKIPLFWLSSSNAYKESMRRHRESGFLPLPTPHSALHASSSSRTQLSFRSHQDFRTYILASSQLHSFKTLIAPRGRHPSTNSFSMICKQSDKCEWKMTITRGDDKLWRCTSVGEHSGHTVWSERDAKRRWEEGKRAPAPKKKREREQDSPPSTSEPKKRQRISKTNTPAQLTTLLTTSKPLSTFSGPSAASRLLKLNLPPKSAAAFSQPGTSFGGLNSRMASFSSSNNPTLSGLLEASKRPQKKLLLSPKTHPFYSTLLAFLSSFEIDSLATDTVILRFLNSGIEEEKNLVTLISMDMVELEVLADKMGLEKDEGATLVRCLQAVRLG